DRSEHRHRLARAQGRVSAGENAFRGYKRKRTGRSLPLVYELSVAVGDRSPRRRSRTPGRHEQYGNDLGYTTDTRRGCHKHARSVGCSRRPSDRQVAADRIGTNIDSNRPDSTDRSKNVPVATDHSSTTVSDQHRGTLPTEKRVRDRYIAGFDPSPQFALSLSSRPLVRSRASAGHRQ